MADIEHEVDNDNSNDAGDNTGNESGGHNEGDEAGGGLNHGVGGGLNRGGSGGLNLGGSGINGWGDNVSDGLAEYNAEHGTDDAERVSAQENQPDSTEVESPRSNLFHDYMRQKVNFDPTILNFVQPKADLGRTNVNFDAAKALDLYGSYPTNQLGIPDFRATGTPAGVYYPSIPTTDGSTPTQKTDTGF
jgi:hypothetical protein